jgi:hypothetical protein
VDASVGEPTFEARTFAPHSSNYAHARSPQFTQLFYLLYCMHAVVSVAVSDCLQNVVA